MFEVAANDPSQLYRRQARRIRSRFAGRPAELYRSLCHLSEQHDSMLGANHSRDLFARRSEQQSGSFAQLVADRLEGSVLRYSARLDLLEVAAGLGISRFHANLIIAAVQHQMDNGDDRQCTPKPTAKWPVATVALLVQSAILFAAWELFAR